MADSRRAFALIIVLLTVAALFALALPAATRSRVAMIEASALRDRALAERNARAAISIVLRGLVPRDAGGSADLGPGEIGGGRFGESGGAGTGGGDAGEGVELPQIIKDLIPELDELDDDLEEEVDEQAAGLARFAQSANIPPASADVQPSILNALTTIGLPREPLRMELNGQHLELRFADALSGVNINQAGDDQLRAYFLAAGVDQPDAVALADQILDWRDDDSVPRSAGAEDPDYRRRLGVECRDDDFSTLEELLYLPAMTPELLDRVRHDFVLAGDGSVHLPTASPAVIASLPGSSPELAAQIVAARKARPLTKEHFDELVPVSMFEFRQRVRLNPTGALRVDVVARGAPEGHPIARFVAHAFLGERGVQTASLVPR